MIQKYRFSSQDNVKLLFSKHNFTGAVDDKEGRASIKVIKESILLLGAKWKPADNIISATDEDGSPVDFKDITVTGSVNTAKTGIYFVYYSLLNKDKKKVSEAALITVVLK